MKLPIILLVLIAHLLTLTSCFDGKTTLETATQEGILIVGNGNEPKALDPHLVSGVVEGNLLRALFEGLCTGHPSEDETILPGAATQWTSNADSTVWTFSLNPLGTWSDGMPVTAYDFIFAYQRMLHPEFPSKYSDMLFFIKNAEEYNKGKVKDFAQVGVKALNEFTLEITLNNPTPFLPELTKHFTWLPVPKHKILEYGSMTEPHTAWTHEGNLISNGPFRLKKWRQNHYIEVEKNPTYWDKDNVKLNGIRFLPIKNINSETRMFLNDQLHVTYNIPPDFIPTALKDYPSQVKQELYIGTRFVRTNTTKPFTSNKKVRQALSLCLNRQSMIDNILQGGQKVAGSMTPPFGSYTPEFQTSYDPERARKLLKEAGYTDPNRLPELSFLTTDSDVNRRMAEAMQAQWKKHLGIRVRIVQREWKSYLKMRSQLEFDLLDGAWIGDYLDPTTFLDLWKSSNGNNNTGWKDASYDAILTEAEVISDPSQRYKKLLEAESYAMAELPAIPVYHYTSNYFLSSGVKNWHSLLLRNQPYKFLELIEE